MRRCHADNSKPNVCVQEGSIAWSICNCEIARKNYVLHMHHKSIFRHTQVAVRDVLISLTKLVCQVHHHAHRSKDIKLVDGQQQLCARYATYCSNFLRLYWNPNKQANKTVFWPKALSTAQLSHDSNIQDLHVPA